MKKGTCEGAEIGIVLRTQTKPSYEGGEVGITYIQWINEGIREKVTGIVTNAK